jgi:hypothetical protein
LPELFRPIPAFATGTEHWPEEWIALRVGDVSIAEQAGPPAEWCGWRDDRLLFQLHHESADADKWFHLGSNRFGEWPDAEDGVRAWSCPGNAYG